MNRRFANYFLNKIVWIKGMRSLARILIFVAFCFPFMGNAQLNSQDLSETKVYTSMEEALQNKDSVYKLDLSKKKLKELPPELFTFYNLRELYLDKNKLKEISPHIGRLSKLEVLSVSKNKLTKLPDEIGDLTNLKRLDLNRNLIESLPETIGALRDLEVLEMWDNELSDIPDELAYLSNLQVLELRGILFSEDEQIRIKEMVPETATVYLSPSCNCKQ